MRESWSVGEAEARRAIETIREELVRRGKVAVIAVGDAHGELVALLRMDGAPLPSVQIATRKVFTAAREKASTIELGRKFQKDGWQMLNSDLAYTGWGGGVPVEHAGQVAGAVAVSGLDQVEDDELARLGVASMTGAQAR